MRNRKNSSAAIKRFRQLCARRRLVPVLLVDRFTGLAFSQTGRPYKYCVDIGLQGRLKGRLFPWVHGLSLEQGQDWIASLIRSRRHITCL